MARDPEVEGADRSSGEDPASLLEAARCPRCASEVDLEVSAIECAGCGQGYPRLGTIPVLLPEPHAYLASCRRQLELLQDQVDRTVQDIREQLREADVLPATRVRCLAMIDAIQAQCADVRAIVEPRLPPDPELRGSGSSDRAPATLEYLPYLYRDWGWPSETQGENERSLATVEAMLEGRPLGRTLVLGAGACRLPYELHRRHPAAELVVMDLDPVLFSAARDVTSGEPVTIREANLEVGDVDHLSREWVLAAPDGPVDAGRFHFVLADAVDPPLAPGIFDTVVTPWFIDQGPDDVRDLVSTLHRMLKPDGRWVNLGPLRYDLDVPIARRFGREELFDLAERAGFRVARWQAESVPYLVSKLNGRGKMEWVLAFAATKVPAPAEAVGPQEGPPAWLIFRHLPIPTFPGQSMFWSKVPAIRTVVSAIDGTRTLDDITLLLAKEARQPDLSVSEVRTAVRQCLAQVHPGCGSKG